MNRLAWTLFLTLVVFFQWSACPSLALASSSSSSMMGMGSQNTGGGDIAVIGCGVLGTSLCEQLLKSSDFSDRTVTGITRTTNNHESIRRKVSENSPYEGRFSIATGDEIQGQRFRDVVFCAPPSGFEDYPEAVRHAVVNVWDSNAGGVFVFTSSGGVYGTTADGGVVTEETPVMNEDIASNPRVARLAKAEEMSLTNGGCCLRLAGLYTLERGAHNYWLTSGKDTVAGRDDGIINLLHYDDAASACMAAIKAGKESVSGKAFLMSDGHPLSRRGICESAMKASMYADASMPKFLGTESDSKGKVYDGSWSNTVLQWSPTFPSFDEFMESKS